MEKLTLLLCSHKKWTMAKNQLLYKWTTEKSAPMNCLSYFAVRKSEAGTKTCWDGFVRSPAFITDQHNTTTKKEVFKSRRLDLWGQNMCHNLTWRGFCNETRWFTLLLALQVERHTYWTIKILYSVWNVINYREDHSTSRENISDGRSDKIFTNIQFWRILTRTVSRDAS